MADTWMVTGQTEHQRLIGRNIVQVMEVGFVTTQGDTGWVDVPVSEYTPENVAVHLHALVDGFTTVHDMPGVTVTQVSMRNDWPNGVETAMVVVAFTTHSGATATITVPADTFDPAHAMAVVAARAEALDHVASL